MRCSICLEESVDFTTTCSHTFHKSCFDSWYATEKSCPLCRSKNPIYSLSWCIKNGDMEGFEKFLAEGNVSDELDENGNGPAHLCAAHDNLEMMVKILPFVDINQRAIEKGETALMIACRRKSTEMVLLLLRNNCNVELRNDYNDNALDMCIYSDNETLLQLLLSCKLSDKVKGQAVITAAMTGSLSAIKLLHGFGAKLNSKTTEQGWNALHVAAAENHVEIVDYLVNLGIDINSKSLDNETPLILACWNGHYETAKYLIEHGCSINKQQKNGEHALIAASRAGLFEIVTLLVAKKAPLMKTDDKGRNALMNAIVGNHPDIVKSIVETAENLPVASSLFSRCCTSPDDRTTNSPLSLILNRSDKGGDSPLILAAWIGNLEVVKYLIAKGADINHKSNDGISPYLTACRYGQTHVARYFIEHFGYDIEDCTADSLTGLMYSAHDGNTELVAYLLEKGAAINRLSSKHWTALIIAANAGKAECVELLISRGANVNLATNKGETALIVACKFKTHECVSMLVKAGADINVMDDLNWSPIQIAVDNKDLLSLKHLVEAGADINICTDHPDLIQFCPLVLGILSENIEIVDYLLQNGAKVSIANEVGRTALHLACLNNSRWIALSLIQHGAGLNDQDLQGVTPLMMCAGKGFIELAKILLDHGADPNITDSEGSTVLMRSVKSYFLADGNGHGDCKHTILAVMRMLVREYDADANVPDNLAETVSNDPVLLEILQCKISHVP